MGHASTTQDIVTGLLVMAATCHLGTTLTSIMSLVFLMSEFCCSDDNSLAPLCISRNAAEALSALDPFLVVGAHRLY
jgi:hypothetical protein